MPPWEEDGRGDVDATLPHCHIATLPGCHSTCLPTRCRAEGVTMMPLCG